MWCLKDEYIDILNATLEVLNYNEHMKLEIEISKRVIISHETKRKWCNAMLTHSQSFFILFFIFVKNIVNHFATHRI